MKKSRFSNEQIAFALKQAETGTPVAEVCRKLGVSEPTFYRWKKKFAGLGVAEVRRPRNRIRQLLKLGTDKRSAILAGLSRKGYWRLSRTLSTHTGMTNVWLAKQGVLSLKEIWVNIHYPDGAASQHRLPR